MNDIGGRELAGVVLVSKRKLLLIIYTASFKDLNFTEQLINVSQPTFIATFHCNSPE